MFTISLTNPDLDFEDPADAIKAFLNVAHDETSGGSVTKIQTYSVLIAWSDSDLEQGNFGTTVRASSHDEAERLAREQMLAFDIDNYGEEDQRGPDSFGSVQECCVGAIWRAAELEDALRAIIHNPGEAELTAARKLIEEIETNAEEVPLL